MPFCRRQSRFLFRAKEMYREVVALLGSSKEVGRRKRGSFSALMATI